MNDNYQVRDEGDPRRYYTQVPNIIDDMDMSVYAFRLYVHLKRVAGDEGKCWQSTDTLAQACRMSAGKVSDAKKELEVLRLIKIEQVDNPRGGRDYHSITIFDIWQRNTSAFSDCVSTSSPYELASSPHELTSSPGEIKNNPIKNNPIKNKEEEAPPPQTEGVRHFMRAMSAKRLNSTQLRTLIELEKAYGTDKVVEIIDWCALRGMTVGNAIQSIVTAAPNWGQKKKSNGRNAPPGESPVEKALREARAREAANGNRR